MTEVQKQAADFVINFYKQNDGVTLHKTTILNAVDQNKFNLKDIRYVLHLLTYKGFLEATDGVVKETLFLTDKGWGYESYEKLLQEEKHKRDLENALITSSIASNKSVRYVNRLFWLTAIFAFASSVGTVGTFILELNKTKQPSSPSTTGIRKDTVKTTQVQSSHLFVPIKK